MNSTRLERLCAAVAAGAMDAEHTDGVLYDEDAERFAERVVRRARALEKAIAEAEPPAEMLPNFPKDAGDDEIEAAVKTRTNELEHALERAYETINIGGEALGELNMILGLAPGESTVDAARRVAKERDETKAEIENLRRRMHAKDDALTACRETIDRVDEIVTPIELESTVDAARRTRDALTRREAELKFFVDERSRVFDGLVALLDEVGACSRGVVVFASPESALQSVVGWCRNARWTIDARDAQIRVLVARAEPIGSLGDVSDEILSQAAAFANHLTGEPPESDDIALAREAATWKVEQMRAEASTWWFAVRSFLEGRRVGEHIAEHRGAKVPTDEEIAREAAEHANEETGLAPEDIDVEQALFATRDKRLSAPWFMCVRAYTAGRKATARGAAAKKEGA